MTSESSALVAHQIAMSAPQIGEAGRTGDWRNEYPVIVDALCLPVKSGRLTCQICWVHCPDACISQGVPPTIDLDHCKGCGICADVCPTNAIQMRPEEQHGLCDLSEEEGLL